MDYPGKVITKTQVTPTQTSASGNWTLDDQAAAIKNNNWPVALVPNPISKSLRFNSADSAYLNRTLTTPTDGKKWTWSGWVKRGILTNGTGTAQQLFSAGSATGYFRFSTTDTLVSGWTGAVNLETTQVFRDASAWYHIMLVVDTTQATASNRVKYYVNGSQITAFSSTDYPTQNSTTTINSAVAHNIGAYTSSTQYFNGYLTEINFIDGQALTPSDFGLTNPQTGQWIPKKYTGTYGTNGFYLNFKDATSTTTLGYDYSGNANNWTTNNFSVTAGADNDSLTDVPTPWTAYNTTGDVGGVVRGNYCTLNPLRPLQSGDSLSNGNLTITTGTTATGVYPATIGISSGKWYWEVLMVTQPAVNTGGVGVAKQGITASFTTGSVLYENSTGNKYIDGTASAYGATWQTNDIIACAYNADTGTFEFFKNGSSQGSFTASSYAGVLVFPVMADGTGQSLTHTYNFGQRPFAYTPPAGFRSLCTTNLPATTIGFGLTNQANNYFNAVTYAGGGAGTVITTGFYPDFAWMKNRTAAFSNFVQDSVRGGGLYLLTDTTDADAAVSPSSTFSSTGITINANSSYASNSSYNYVAWAWKANAGSTVSNTAGSITSTVSANTTAGFSVVTYTGNGTNGASVGHGLGVAPSMIIIKNRTDSASAFWCVYHRSAYVSGADPNVLYLNSTQAQTDDTNVWGSSPDFSSTIFKLGDYNGSNGSGDSLVAYCFAAVPGYSAFGSYTGNGSADGPFVYLGFRPEFVMIKRTSAADNWVILDAARSSANPTDEYLWANLSSAEVANLHAFDFLSNGFKIRNATSDHNTNGSTYIYMAFAESPFQFANAR